MESQKGIGANMDNLNYENNQNMDSKKLTSSQLRKIKKPMIEKRRRERINESLTQLKSLILEALNKDESQYNKMEKADILELTVKHLKTIHKQQHHQSTTTTVVPQAVAIAQPLLQPVHSPAQDVNTEDNYKAGFVHCATEVQRYMQSVNSLRPEVKNHISNHLNCKMHGIEVPVTQDKQDKLLQPPQPVSATYVQILSKDGSGNLGGEQCLNNPVLQGVPCLQPVSVLNGQTIFVAGTIPPNYNTAGQIQPVLQLAQPVMSNTNLQYSATVSSSTEDNRTLSMESSDNQVDDNGNIMASSITCVSNNKNNERNTSKFQQNQHNHTGLPLSPETPCVNRASEQLNVNQKNICNRFQYNSTESNTSLRSIKAEETFVNSQTYYRNLNNRQIFPGHHHHRSVETSNFAEQKFKQQQARLPSQSVLVDNQRTSQPAGFDSMWRPW